MVLMSCIDSKLHECLGILLSALPLPAGPGCPTTHRPTLATSNWSLNFNWISLHFYPPYLVGVGSGDTKWSWFPSLFEVIFYPLFSSTYYKVGMILKRLARPLHESKFMKYSVWFFYIPYYRDTHKPCLLRHLHNNQNTERAQMHGSKKRGMMCVCVGGGSGVCISKIELIAVIY